MNLRKYRITYESLSLQEIKLESIWLGKTIFRKYYNLRVQEVNTDKTYLSTILQRSMHFC